MSQRQSTEQPENASTAADAADPDLLLHTSPDQELTPRQIAIKRTSAALARLAEAHEGWLLVARALYLSGAISADEELAAELFEFGDAICARYAAGDFLWEVLDDMDPADWFGPREKFDATLRRLKTLKGLEGSLVCWEKVMLDLINLIDGREEENSEEFRREIKGVLARWRRGLPTTP